MLPFNRANPRKQGDVGMGSAVGWFAANGYTVSLPLTDSQDYDVVVDDGSGLSRVQVRTTRHRKPNGFYEVGLRVKGGNRSGTGKVKHFDPTKVELLYLLTEAGDKYLIPSTAVGGTRSLTLGTRYESFRVS